MKKFTGNNEYQYTATYHAVSCTMTNLIIAGWWRRVEQCFI